MGMSISEHRVERAIIMAAGIGKRMQPVTLRTPKPLVRVNGIRMIDTLISALHQNGVFEIYVVVGYLKEQFYEWALQYDGIHLIENPWFDSCNNIASLYVARNYLENAVILDGDQIIRDSHIIFPEFSRSGYNCIWTECETNEWLMTVQDGTVVQCSRNGGRQGWQLFSISRWTKEDGKKLRGQLEYEFEVRKNRGIYWDDVVMFCYPEQYQLGVLPMQPDDLLEIDSFEELVQIDKGYKNEKQD